MWARIQLANDGGSPGPTGTIDASLDTVNDAIAWAESQVGHPYDCILVSVYEDETDTNPVETYQIEYRDGAWECV